MHTTKKIFNDVRKLISLNKLTDAKIALQPLITRNYNDYSLHSLLGIIYHLEDKFDRAVISYKKALELNPEDLETLVNFSILYYDIGKYEDAKELYDRALNVKSYKPKADNNSKEEQNTMFATQHIQVAKLYMRYKRFNEALLEVEKAIKLDKGLEEAYLLRAECVFEKGEPERAVLLLSKLKTTSPEYLEARIKLGTYFYKLGDTVSAINEWEKVLSIDPYNIEAKHFLNMYEEHELR